MDRSIDRKDLIQSYLESKLGFPNRYYPTLSDHILVNKDRTHFSHVLTGKQEGKPIYQVLRHLEIDTNNSIIIHQNEVDKPIEAELEILGIPAEDIVFSELEPMPF